MDDQKQARKLSPQRRLFPGRKLDSETGLLFVETVSFVCAFVPQTVTLPLLWVSAPFGYCLRSLSGAQCTLPAAWPPLGHRNSGLNTLILRPIEQFVPLVGRPPRAIIARGKLVAS